MRAFRGGARLVRVPWYAFVAVLQRKVPSQVVHVLDMFSAAKELETLFEMKVVGGRDGGSDAEDATTPEDAEVGEAEDYDKDGGEAVA